MSAPARTEDVRVRARPGRSGDPRLLGVVVGATWLEVGVTDVRDRVLGSARCPVGLSDGPDAVVAGVLDVVRGLRADGVLGELHGAGVGLPATGCEHASDGRADRGGWAWSPLHLALAQRLGCPVRVAEDTHVTALGAARAAAGGPVDDLVYVDLGDSVRCGVVLAGAVHHGAGGTAGLVGHGRAGAVEEDAPPCACGRTGCLDAYVGAPALVRAARALAVDGSPLLLERQRSTGRLVPADLAAAAAAGDAAATTVVRDAGRRLGAHLAGPVGLLDPAVVVLGGEVAAALGEPLVAELRRTLARRCPARATSQVSVVLSAPGARAGVVGAARLARDEVLVEL